MEESSALHPPGGHLWLYYFLPAVRGVARVMYIERSE
jgi:hypothetical protein